MKKHTEKPPIDDLFARKLGNISLPPSTGGFGRLQARMGKSQPEIRAVFWRDPAVQRYIAVAACLLLVSLFGWLYWPSGNATNNLAENRANKKRLIDQESGKTNAASTTHDGLDSNSAEMNRTGPATTDSQVGKEQVARVIKPAAGAHSSLVSAKPIPETKPVYTAQLSVAQTKPAEGKLNAEPTPQLMPPTADRTPELAAKNQSEPAQTAERVLVVTIAEPEALVAARQTAISVVNDMPILAANPSKEGKATFWQQVKRLKQDDDVARQEKPVDEEGLLSRAYKGIRNRLEKDKSAKQ